MGDCSAVTIGGDAELTLEGRYVWLEALSVDHLDDLVLAVTEHRPPSEYADVPADAPSMRAYVDRLLSARDLNLRLPFAQRRRADGRVVGCTSFLDPHVWRGRMEPDEIEIGGTWLDRTAQRTAMNTEAKLLLLRHAFETWKVWRVAIATDERNEVSRRAIERLGAVYEGTLRNHRPSYAIGTRVRPRNTAMFSITDREWPAVAHRLERLLAEREV
jgi:RimJ/RimL family protein N-acetyltransferase